MNDRLIRLLRHLEEILDPARQDAIENRYRRALRYESVDRLPLILNYPVPADSPFQPFPHSQVFDDPEKMLYNELVHAFDTSIACRDRIDDDLPCTIRANFGTVIIASLFGGRVEQVGENPPWVRHFETLTEFRNAMSRNPLDFSAGWCPKVIDRYRFYRHILGDFPSLQKMIRVVLPDLQGPLDTAELLRGSDLFLDLYAAPETVAVVLRTIARAQVGFARHLAPYVTNTPEGFSYQHAVMMRGNFLIRDDSAILISPRMYREQIAPHDEYVLGEMGAGGIHACGRIDHVVGDILSLPSVCCLDLGQPQMNDLDAIYAVVRQRKIPLVRVRVTEEELTTGSVMDRFPTGITLAHEAGSFDEARRIMSAYRKATERQAVS